MDYHETTLARYMDEVSKEEALNDAIERTLVKIEEEYPNVLPDDFDACYEIGYDIVINDRNIDSYMEDYIEHKEKTTNGN